MHSAATNLQQKTKDGLQRHPAVAAFNIAREESNGTVTPSGAVGSIEEAERVDDADG